MQIPTQIPAVWVYSSSATYNELRREGYGKFLTPAQQTRLERIRQARLLFDGKHREYFLDERRTQFDFSPMRAQEMVMQPYLMFNLIKKCCKKIADLLFGAEPLLRVLDPMQRAALSLMSERTGFHRIFYSAATSASYEGEAMIEAIRFNGQVYMQVCDAAEFFPIGDLQPDGQYAEYDRFRLQNIGTEDAKIMLLLIECYTAGRIERHAWQLDQDGQKEREVDVKNWPMPMGSPPLEAVTVTGIDENTITWIANELERGCPVSDIDGVINLQDELNAKMTQLGRVIAKHADPKMAFPSRAGDDQGTIRAGHDSFFFIHPDNIPKYITWNAELASAMKDRDFVVTSLLTEMEVSPLLLGMRQAGAHAEAFKTVRVQSYTSICKAGRKAPYWKSGIARCLRVAQKLEQGNGTRYDIGPVPLELRDGLPVDAKEQADTISINRASGVMSVHEGLMELHNGDESAVAAEEAELGKENAAKQPTVIIGMGKPDGLEQQQQTGAEEEASDDGAEADTQEVAA